MHLQRRPEDSSRIFLGHGELTKHPSVYVIIMSPESAAFFEPTHPSSTFGACEYPSRFHGPHGACVDTAFVACKRHDSAFWLHHTTRSGCRADCKHTHSNEKALCRPLKKAGGMEGYGKCMSDARKNLSKCRSKCTGMAGRWYSGKKSQGSSDNMSSQDSSSYEDVDGGKKSDSSANDQCTAAIAIGRKQWNRVLLCSFL